MARNTMEHRSHYKTEASNENSDFDFDTKVDILTRYTEKLSETHPEILKELSILHQHQGRDNTDWNKRLQEHDLPDQYTYSFRKATEGMEEHEKHYAAQETAKALGMPLESKLEDFRTEVTFSQKEDKLDPESYGALLKLTWQTGHKAMENCKEDLTEALNQAKTEDFKDAIQSLNAATYYLEKTKEEGTISNFHLHYNGDRFQEIADYRNELLDHRFKDHIAAEHPSLQQASPADQNFQEAFRDFTKDYLPGDTERLAGKYASEAASTAVHPQDHKDVHDFATAWYQEKTDIYHALLTPKEETKNPTYRDLLLSRT